MSILNRITTVKWNFDLQVAHKVLQFTSLLFVCSAMDSRELITFLSSSVEENIEITIERTYTKLPFDSFVRSSFHVCKDIWSPLIGEELNYKHEDQNKHDNFNLAIYWNALIYEFLVGHVPLNFLNFFSKFYSFQILRYGVKFLANE